MADRLFKLLGRSARDLAAAVALARGEEVSDSDRRRLRRRGIVAATGEVELSLLGPLLALEQSVEQAPLHSLYRALRSSAAERERGRLLGAIEIELERERAQIGSSDAAHDLDLLEDLRKTTERLAREGDADAAQAMRVAGLCAEIVERIAARLTRLRRPPRRRREPQPRHSAAELAAAVGDLCFRAPRPLAIPTSGTLAAALAGPLAPRQTKPRPISLHRERSRVDRVSEALQRPLSEGAGPMDSLYGSVASVEALATHAALAQLGRRGLERLHLISTRGWLRGLGELDAASELKLRPAVASPARLERRREVAELAKSA